MQITNLNQLVQEALKRIDAIPTVPQMPPSMSLPLTTMDEVDHAEAALKNKKTFDATVSIAALIQFCRNCKSAWPVKLLSVWWKQRYTATIR